MDAGDAKRALAGGAGIRCGQTLGSTLAFTATLLSDSSAGKGAHTSSGIEHFEVTAGRRDASPRGPRSDPGGCPGRAVYRPVGVGLGVSGEGGTAVLPAFYVMPLRRDTFPAAAGSGCWADGRCGPRGRDQMSQAGDQEDGVVERVVEWRPTMVKAINLGEVVAMSTI